MPAQSKSQQRLFGMVHAIQKGTLDKDSVSEEVRRMAKDIDPESVNHFAETKHTKLPEKKKKKVKKSAFTDGFLYKCAFFGVDPKALLGYYGGSIQSGDPVKSQKKLLTPYTQKTFNQIKPIEPLVPKNDTAGSLLEKTKFGKYHINWNGIGNVRTTAQKKNDLTSKYVPQPEK